MASAGFSKPSEDDDRGWLWFVSILSVIYSLAFFGVRICGKYDFLWWDDLCLGLGYLVSFARSGLTMSAISRGLGARSDAAITASEPSVSRHIFIARILLQVCLYAAKFSIALFTRRIFSGDMRHERLIFVAYFASLALSCLAAVLLSAVGCESTSLLLEEACAPNRIRLIITAVLDVATEIIIIAVPAYFLTGLQMARGDKRRAIVLFAFRIGVIALTIALTTEALHHEQTPPNWSTILVLQDILLTYSFISATIPCVRSFLGAFFSPFLSFPGFARTLQGSTTGYSVALRSLSSKKDTVTSQANEDVHVLMRPDQARYEIQIRHSQSRRAEGTRSVGSDDSERMMIRRQTEVYVHSDAGD